MFTGLIETIGKIKEVVKNKDGLTLSVFESCFDDLKIGDSIAINGVCQTITEIGSGFFSVQTVNETLNLTNLGGLKVGQHVNLERAMSALGRFGGHFVSGHIDGVSKLISVKKNGFSTILKFEFDTKYIIKKGSIAVNGVSLTVSATGDNFFEVNLIPHSLENTNLKELKTGDFVNIEIDMFAKYVEKFLCERDNNEGGNKSKIDENFLKECGF